MMVDKLGFKVCDAYHRVFIKHNTKNNQHIIVVIAMDDMDIIANMSTLHSPTRSHGLHEHSMSTQCGVHGVHDCIYYSLHRIHVHSMDSAQTVFHGLCALYSIDCSWTLHGLHEDSFLIYLRKNNFNHIYINNCFQQKSNSGPFSHYTMTCQPTELTGHVGMGLFKKYIIPTSHDTYADQPTSTNCNHV